MPATSPDVTGTPESDERVIAIGPRGYAAVWPQRPVSRETTTYAVTRGFWNDLELYDASGRVWRVGAVELPHGTAGWRRVLARTVWNPQTMARISYQQPTSYDLPELRDALRRALAADDDVLTQFHETREIQAWLEEAASFAEIVAVLERAEQP